MEKDRLLEYQAEGGATGRITCTPDGATATADALLRKLEATDWEIRYFGGAVSQGRRNPTAKW